jgi:hypothetical protein
MAEVMVALLGWVVVLAGMQEMVVVAGLVGQVAMAVEVVEVVAVKEMLPVTHVPAAVVAWGYLGRVAMAQAAVTLTGLLRMVTVGAEVLVAVRGERHPLTQLLVLPAKPEIMVVGKGMQALLG